MSDDLEMEWEAPPPVAYVASKYRRAIDQVKERPGQWLMIRKHSGSATLYSARDRIKALTKHDKAYECVVTRLDDAEYGLYIRYRTAEQMKE